MKELAKNTSTADSRIGSHSEIIPVMRTSPMGDVFGIPSASKMVAFLRLGYSDC
jgi:hypothetical protein